MKRKNIQLDLKSCETLAIPPDQDENSCAYFLIRKCPRLKAVHLAEYGVFRAWGMGASRVMLGFSPQAGAPGFHAKNYGELKLRYTHSMLLMKKKLELTPAAYETAVRIKPIEQTEIPAYMRIYRETFFAVPNAACDSEEQIRRLLREQNYDVCLLRCGKNPCGICEYRISPQKEAFLEALGVLPQFRRQNLARGALHNLYYLFQAEGVKRVCLYVSSANLPALRLYKSEGFTVEKAVSHWFEAL